MSDLCLTVEELEAPLRLGRRAKHRPQPSRIVSWYRENGFTIAAVSPDGYPVISRRHWEERTGGGKPKGRQKTEPNRAALVNDTHGPQTPPAH